MDFSQSSSKAALAAGIPSIIYVEGKDDAYFVNCILREINADPKKVGVIYMEGDGALNRELSLLTKSASYVQRKTMKLAFILDADDSAEVRLQHVNAAFQSYNLPTVGHGDFEPYDNGRSVGLYVLPDGLSSGELEDLLLLTVATDDRLETVRKALSEVEGKHGQLNKRSKRVARMYISVLPIKPCGVGRAYCEGVFEQAHNAVEHVRAFVSLMA